MAYTFNAPTRSLGEHIGRFSDDAVQDCLDGIVDSHGLTAVLAHLIDYVADYEVNHTTLASFAGTRKAYALKDIAEHLRTARKVSRERFDS